MEKKILNPEILMKTQVFLTVKLTETIDHPLIHTEQTKLFSIYPDSIVGSIT